MIQDGAKGIISCQKNDRLSIAGVQHKTTILIGRDNLYYRPNFDYPSTHIIKFNSPHFPSLLKNELFIMRLAELLNLECSQMKYISDYGGYLLIDRFDRKVSGDSIMRIQQEDFCQILTVPSINKYQKEGGPSFKEIVSSIRAYGDKAAKDILRLAKILVFNFIVGNCDYHGKKIATMHNSNELTPLLRFGLNYSISCINRNGDVHQ